MLFWKKKSQPSPQLRPCPELLSTAPVPSEPYILIVDDDILFAKMAQETLELEGYKVRCYYDGDQLKLKPLPSGLRLVLLDFMMPTLNGLEVLEYLRKQPSFATTPVVLCSVN